MSLYRRGGVWWSRIEVDKRVYQFTTKTGNKNTARSVEATFRADKLKQASTASTPEMPTLDGFARQFINQGVVGRVSKQTFRYYVCHWITLEKSPLGELPLDRIDRKAIDDFVSWRRKQRVTATTVNHGLRTLRRALHLAVEWGYLAKVPKIRLLPGERQREYILSDTDIERFAKDPRLIGKIIPFLCDTGLRRRELCTLLWRDVSSNGKEIHITKGKTRAARRRIPLTDRAVKILAELPREKDHVFTDRYGHALDPDWLSNEFLRARRKLEIPDEAVLHSTRHTFCSRLGEKGASAFEIQRLAGHSSITISQRYVHPSAGKLDSAISLLNG
jgi:integrase